jgi:hypothetical protein
MSRLRLGAIGGAVIVVLGVFTGPAANAATDKYGVDDLTAEQRQAIATWETSGSKVVRDAPIRAVSLGGTDAATTAAAGGVKTLKLYRGSWMMWGEENVQFGYSGDGRTVNWSSGWQNSGWIFPNNVTEGGTVRYTTSSTLHRWRGKYTVGAGVPTPWGPANVYSATSYAQSDIRNIGSLQWWLN